MNRAIRNCTIAALITFFNMFCIPEKKIVVVVCSYNNHEWTENTLDSIFTQNYSNFRMILVDDCSSDGNQQVILNYIDKYQLHDRITFIQNETRRRKLFNLYRVLYECDDDEIVVMVDGDDSLAHPNILSQINKIYEDENIWFTYGQYKNVPASQAIEWGHKEMGYCRPVPKHIVQKHAYRYYSFIFMHLRSFRGWLFKLIKLEDLIADTIQGFEGDFYPASNDVAMYFPMVEMAHTHIKFVPDILYIRNLYSEIVGFKVDRKIQTASAREIRKKSCYQALFKPIKNRLAQFTHSTADFFILCKDSIASIGNTIEHIKQQTTFLGTIYVFFNDSTENKTLCRKIKTHHPNVVFVTYTQTGTKSLRNRLLDSCSCSTANHFVFSTDSLNCALEINLSDAIYNLEKTYAHSFYLNRTKSNRTSRFVNVNDKICAWKFNSSMHGWDSINPSNDPILLRKSDALKDISNWQFEDTADFINVLYQNNSSQTRLGLFFQ